VCQADHCACTPVYRYSLSVSRHAMVPQDNVVIAKLDLRCNGWQCGQPERLRMNFWRRRAAPPACGGASDGPTLVSARYSSSRYRDGGCVGQQNLPPPQR
jgi:hypothetical protein